MPAAVSSRGIITRRSRRDTSYTRIGKEDRGEGCLQECPADGDDIRDEEDGGAGVDGGAMLRLCEDQGPVHIRCHIYTPANTCTRVRGVRTGATHETSNRHAVLVSCR